MHYLRMLTSSAFLFVVQTAYKDVSRFHLRPLSYVQIAQIFSTDKSHDGKLFLNVGAQENDEVNRLGAYFDRSTFRWYITQSHSKSKFAKYLVPRLYLNVPYADKDKAKLHGARWDPNKKKWYVPSHIISNEQILAIFTAQKWLDPASLNKATTSLPLTTTPWSNGKPEASFFPELETNKKAPPAVSLGNSAGEFSYEHRAYDVSCTV